MLTTNVLAGIRNDSVLVPLFLLEYLLADCHVHSFIRKVDAISWSTCQPRAQPPERIPSCRGLQVLLALLGALEPLSSLSLSNITVIFHRPLAAELRDSSGLSPLQNQS